MRVVEKVFAYVTRRGRLLVFRQPGAPEAGIQVPAGTLEAGETPADGVLREAREETGLECLVLARPLGTTEFDMRAYGRAELQRRHFYELRCDGPVRERWVHEERHPSDGSAPVPFEFFWVELREGIPALIAGHDALLDSLSTGPDD